MTIKSHRANITKCPAMKEETRMVITEHTTKAINSDYTHLELPKLKAAIGKLPSLKDNARRDAA
jgi:hypothetical protein